MGLLSSLGKGIAKALDVTTVALAHPVQTTTAVLSKKSTVNDVITSHFSQPVKEQVKDIVLGTGAIAATVVAGAAIGTAAKAGTLPSVAKALIPTSTKGKVVAAIAAPIVVGAIAKEPVKTIEAAAKAPGALSNFGGNVATFAANPSIETAKQIIKENPVVSTLAGGAALAAVGAGTAGLIATVTNTAAVKENTKASVSPPAVTVVDKSSEFKAMPVPDNVVAAKTPVTPQTQTVSNKSPVKRKKRTTKAVIPSMSQRVNVLVQNNSNNRLTKKYIKRGIVAYA